jgi:hypothetical protein
LQYIIIINTLNVTEYELGPASFANIPVVYRGVSGYPWCCAGGAPKRVQNFLDHMAVSVTEKADRVMKI